MKIKLTDIMKHAITLDEVPAMKNLCNSFKNTKDFKWEADAAAYAASCHSLDVLKVESEVAKNSRLQYNYFGGEDSPTYQFDVWLTIYAYSITYGFYRIGCYLSDIWSLGSENAEEIKSHMYILHYVESEKV